MSRMLRRRIPRELKENLWRWTALFLMIVLGMYIVTAVVGAAENIITGSRKEAENNLVEDGEFSTWAPLTKEQEKFLRDNGIILEEKFSLDIGLEDGSTLRFMKNRGKINLIALHEGKIPEENGEILIEKRYCQEHNYAIGDKIQIAGREFKIVGIGTTPDYDLPLRNFSDMSAESTFFGTAFVTAEQYEAVLADNIGKNEDYTYSYRLEDKVTEDFVKQSVKNFEHNKLISFVNADKNPRILAAAGDSVMNKQVGLFAGVIVMALFSYVISVFVIHQINRELSVIGTLYAMGVKRRELLWHYITLPTIIAFLGGIAGAALGFSQIGIERQTADIYAYFSLPKLDRIYPAYLIIYAVAMPPIISIIVNFFVINSRLSQTALSLIRNEQKSSKLYAVRLKGSNFIRNFCMRQMLREVRTSITVIVGMFIALLIFMLGMNCFVLCNHVKIDTANSTRFQYMYALRLPAGSVPEGGEACYSEILTKTEKGYTLDIMLFGIDHDNKFFDASPQERKNSIVTGSAVATKYGLRKGDQLILSDSANDVDYAFTVEDICDYSAGLAVFMDIDSMRELFGREDEYYNTLLSDKPLDIPDEQLYSVTSREDIKRSSEVFIEMMKPMVTMMLSVSIILFFAVIYLMTGVMIDRAAFGISLIKIFGFRTKEIRSLYLNGNTLTAAVGAVICIPAAKIIMDAIYPWLISNVGCGMNLRFEWYFYLLIFGGIMLVYWISSALLTQKINNITPAEALKNRE